MARVWMQVVVPSGSFCLMQVALELGNKGLSTGNELLSGSGNLQVVLVM